MDVPGRSLDAAPTDIVPAEVAHGGDASRHATACYLRVAGGRPRGGDAHKRYAGSCMYGSTMQTHTHTMHFPIKTFARSQKWITLKSSRDSL